MNHKIIIVIGLIVLGMLVLFTFFDYKKKSELGDQSGSPNILYITQPVTSFSGIVEKIEGNRLTVSLKQTLIQNVTPPPPVAVGVSPLPIPTPKIVTITYQIVASDKTQIYQFAPYVNYLFKTVAPVPPRLTTLTIKDIKVGQYITLNSQVDLRTFVGTVFETNIINLPPITNTLNGKIISLEGDILTIKGKVIEGTFINSAPVVHQEKEYRITIMTDTEISRMSSSVPKNEKLSTSDLKKDMQVVVYTAEDVTESQTLTALRIEPVQVMPNIVSLAPEANAPISPAPSASASPSIKP